MRFLLLALLTMTAAPARAAQPPPAAPEADAAYYFLLGRRLEGQGKVDEAIAAHKRAIELDGTSAELRAELAGLYARQDKALEALELAEAAIERDANNVEANRILGSVYAAFADQRRPLRPGDNPAQYASRAIAALEKARREGSFDIGIELTLGRLYLQTGEYDKAVPVLERVVLDQPGYTEAAFLLAGAQEGAGQVDGAIRTLEAVVAINPASYRAQVRIGELYERQQRWKEAAEAFGRAQSLNPRATPLTARRAAALINGGNAAEARDIVQQALAAAKPGAQDPMLMYLLAESQRTLGELDAARATAQKLLDADGEDARGLHVMSLILQDKGEHKEAEQVLRKLIARDPLDANALNSLGYMLAERRERLDEAVDLVQRALKVEPGNPSYLDSLGWAYFQQGRLDLADGPLTQAAEKLRESSVVQDHLGDLRFKQQRYADAAAAWERALAGDRQSIDRDRIEQKLRDARSRMDK